AVAQGRIRHNGDPDLARHVYNAVAKDEARGTRIVKEAKRSTRFIDACVALIMAFDRAAQAPDDYDVLASIA
ncbi:MAG: terminase TerL endonuclease subunit, partial [Candidatus Sericytochromatia bacterium]